MPVKVMGYTPDIETLMGMADVMVTKLGGLTTFEAMASGLHLQADDGWNVPFVREAVEADELTLHGLWTDIGAGGLEQYDPASGTFVPL